MKAPPGRTTRPTADRVRESVFNILGPAVVEASVLDLYAGSGALGIEALSRGATFAAFVERDRRALAVLEENLQKAGFVRASLVVPGRIPLDHRSGPLFACRFDLVFMDPPYDQGEIRAAFAWLEAASLVLPGAILVVEHSLREEIPSKLTKFEQVREERYNETRVSFLRARSS